MYSPYSRFGPKLLLHAVSPFGELYSRRIIHISGYVYLHRAKSIQQNTLQKRDWDTSTNVFSKCINLYSTTSENTRPETNKDTGKTTETQKKKPDSGPIITLMGMDNLTVLSLSEAEKIAKRRDLKLVKIVDYDTKTQRPIYKLMSGAQYYEEDRKQRQEKQTKKDSVFKGEKLLTISHKIATHDLGSRAKNIKKWLSKTYEVRIIINGDAENMKTAEQVYDAIVESVKTEGRIVQKRQKGSDIRFQILPPKKEKAEKDKSD